MIMEYRRILLPVFCIFTSLAFDRVIGDSKFCFGCRDTTDSEGGDDCQSDIKSMEDLHSVYKNEYGINKTEDFRKKYGSNPLVHDCNITSDFKYCCIEEIERFGAIQSYIRGCCDGKTFSVNRTLVPKLQYVKPNNQTLCTYHENKGVIICVTMCEGPFCNGPSTAESVHIYSFGLLILCIFVRRFFVM